MQDVAIVEAVRTPIGRRGGRLASVPAPDLLGHVLRACLERSQVDAEEVQQVLGGCVSAVGEQAINITRTAWLSAGLPQGVAATTIDAQCGSSQQATSLAASLVASGNVDVTIACGVESMSRVPLGSNVAKGPGRWPPASYRDHYEPTTQFIGAERIATRWGVTRDDADAFGLRSQHRARTAWDEGHFDRETVPVRAPDFAELGEDAEPVRDITRHPTTTTTHEVRCDEGLRRTSREKLAALDPVMGPDGVHTAGTSSQVSDGAAALLLMSTDRADALGLPVRARVRAHTLVGVDPELMLTGPIDATARLLDETGLGLGDFDTIEVNEAFASVVLAWQREFGLSDDDMERVNPSGGAIALGHPVGCTGARLLTTALHTLERLDGHRALVTMCCGGGLGTGTLIQRV